MTGTALSARPTWRFLVAAPAHFIALGAGSGLPRRAPGTFGTLFGWIVFALVQRGTGSAPGPAGWIAACAVLLPIGAWAAQRTGAALGVADSGHIVIDEVVAVWLVLALTPVVAPSLVARIGPWPAEAIGFVLFRGFDIAKPPPIRQFDRRLKNGWGVMLDDLLAALYTLLVVGSIGALTGAPEAIAIH